MYMRLRDCKSAADTVQAPVVRAAVVHPAVVRAAAIRAAAVRDAVVRTAVVCAVRYLFLFVTILCFLGRRRRCFLHLPERR